MTIARALAALIRETVEVPEPALEHAKLAVLDRWGKTLTVITAAYGLLIMIISAYEAWLRIPFSY